MDELIRLGVYRNLDNRKEGLPDDSPRAKELHRLRAVSLHDIFDSVPGAKVVDWGATDASEPHEFVELLLSFTQWVMQPTHLHAASATALEIGKLLGTAAVGESVKEGVKWLFEKCRKKQQAREIMS